MSADRPLAQHQCQSCHSLAADCIVALLRRGGARFVRKIPEHFFRRRLCVRQPCNARLCDRLMPDTYPRYIWAFEMFWSRCLGVQLNTGDAGQVASVPTLVPLVDMLNHSEVSVSLSLVPLLTRSTLSVGSRRLHDRHAIRTFWFGGTHAAPLPGWRHLFLATVDSRRHRARKWSCEQLRSAFQRKTIAVLCIHCEHFCCCKSIVINDCLQLPENSQDDVAIRLGIRDDPLAYRLVSWGRL